MESNSPDAREDQVASLLAACDEALMAGADPAALPEAADAPADVRSELERGLACVQLLREALPASSPAGVATVVAAGAETLTLPQADLSGQPPPAIGRFQVRRELGRGACGVVFLAYDPQLRRDIALKVPRLDSLLDPAAHERFLREAQTAAQLDHPNLVAVHDAGEAGAVCYIASAYCPGITLWQWLKQRQQPVPGRLAARLVATLAAAVQHAHDHGIIHRDLKPANVLLGPLSGAATDEMDFVPHITDFGLAKVLVEGANAPTLSGVVVGTPCYMPPEQAGGRTREVGAAADVYALGAILYELLTGRPPFQGETAWDVLQQVQGSDPVPPGRLRAKLPRDLETICLKCLEKEPKKRYPSAAALSRELQCFLDGTPIEARPTSRTERAWKWAKRRPAVAALTALSVVLAVVGFGLVTWQWLDTEAALAAAEMAEGDARRAQADEAEHRGRAETARQQEAELRRQFQRQSAGLLLDRGINLCEQGDVGRGLLWMERGLRIAAPEDADLRRVIRTNLADWHTRFSALQAIFPHVRGVTAVAFSPDGKLVLTGCKDRYARLWDLATGKLVGEPLTHLEEVWAAVFSPDGKSVLTGCSDGKARLWDVPWTKTTRQPREFPHKDVVLAVAFHPGGHAVLTGSRDKTARLWDLATDRVVTFSHLGAVSSVAFRPDGKAVLTGCTDRAARLWDATTGLPIGTPPLRLEHAAAVWAVAFSRDGKKIVTGSYDNTARLWEATTGRSLGLPMQHDVRVDALCFSPDGKKVLTASLDHTARFWDAMTGQLLGASLLPHQSQVCAIASSPDGRSVLTGSEEGGARIWKAVADGDLAVSLPVGSTSVYAMAFRPDGKALLTAGYQVARLWDADTGKSIGPSLQHQDRVVAVGFAPDGKLAVTGSWDRMTRMWDAATGRQVGSDLEHQGRVLALAVSPDGQTLMTGSREDGRARLWNIATGKPVGSEMPHGTSVLAVAFRPDGRAVVTSAGGRVRVWDLATGKPTILLHGDVVYAVAFSPDGQRVLTGSGDRTGRLWHPVTGKVVTLQHQGSVRGVAFSPDGKLALTAAEDRTVRLWDARTGTQIATLPHPNGILTAAFSPDGKTVVTGCRDYRARLWDVATAKPLGQPLVFKGELAAVAFSPDSKRVAAGGWDPNAQLRSVPTPLDVSDDRLTLWLQVLTGMEIDAHDTVGVLDASEWQKRRQRLQELGGPPVP